eukprot:352941-Chlamydomonas_euryale.AAC.4
MAEGLATTFLPNAMQPRQGCSSCMGNHTVQHPIRRDLDKRIPYERGMIADADVPLKPSWAAGGRFGQAVKQAAAADNPLQKAPQGPHPHAHTCAARAHVRCTCTLGFLGM